MPPSLINQHKNGMLTPKFPSATVTTTNARSRKTTRKGGKSRGVAKAPRGRGRAATARPAAAAPPPPNASAAAPTTAEASTQTDGEIRLLSSCSMPLHTNKPEELTLQRFATAVLDQSS